MHDLNVSSSEHRQRVEYTDTVFFFLDFRVAFKQSWRVWPPRLSLSVSWQTEERLLMDSDGLSCAAPLLSNGKSNQAAGGHICVEGAYSRNKVKHFFVNFTVSRSSLDDKN